MTDRIPARTPDGDDHHVVYEGPAHLLPAATVLFDLPPAPDGEEWILVRRPVNTGETP